MGSGAGHNVPIVNLGVGVRFASNSTVHNLSLHCDNLFDRLYRDHLSVIKDFVPQRDATITIKMKKAGAVIIGKTTMGEFAAGFLGSAFGTVRNPYSPERSPSGSSAGTGAGVAANFATVGIGEDTGGSVRGPAAFNSLVGLRPSVPLVSRFGMMPATPSQDTLGPIGRTVKYTALLLDVIAGYDPNDPVTAYAARQVPPTYTAFLNKDGLRGARLGVIARIVEHRRQPFWPFLALAFLAVVFVVERWL